MTKSFPHIQDVEINVEEVYALDFLFSIEEDEYRLSVGRYMDPFSIDDVEYVNGDSYQSYGGKCEMLNERKEELFDYLITLPSISWKWDRYRKPEILSLQMTNVHQKKRENNNIDIFFTLQECSFYLVVSESDFCYSPYKVLQMGGDHSTGRFFEQLLTLYKEDLFRHLIEFPSIRLEWLYIPHALAKMEEYE